MFEHDCVENASQIGGVYWICEICGALVLKPEREEVVDALVALLTLDKPMFPEDFLAKQNATTRAFLEEHMADYEANKDDPRWRAEQMQPLWVPVILPGAKKGHAGKQNADGSWRVLCRSPRKTIPAPPADATDDTFRVTCVTCRAKLGIRNMGEK
jgi:hypothetical protein